MDRVSTHRRVQISGATSDLQSLAEPARTGFTRHRANRIPLAKPEPMAQVADYISFLMKP